ncbi:hypothetical protein GX563_01515 [Candidatus Bathyarchaeota archaeon]|nr:hypothetical protein [Candidatus Bathyarchaeota archaeon]
MSTPPSSFLLLFLVTASVFGLALIPMLIVQPSMRGDDLLFRRPLVGTLFGVICVLGIVAVFYPVKCRLMFQKPSFLNSDKAPISRGEISGHHPNCENYSANRIKIVGRVFCAACSGLLVGAIVALALTFLFILGFINSGFGSLWAFAVGAALMLLGLTQIKFGGFTKAALNALFVVGSYVLLVAVDLVAQSLLLDFYTIGLIVYLLWIRILFSEWHNKRTCFACSRCL